MTSDLLLALWLYALVSSITPGPNNLMLLASGVNFGFWRTVPHILGITLGHSFMVFVIGIGLAGAFQRWPVLQTVLTVVSVAYLLWLAWKIAHATPPEPGEAGGKPLTPLQAAAFQWVNPKAWTMALGAITLYAPGTDLRSVLLVVVVFASTNLPSVSLWAGMGTALRRVIDRAAAGANVQLQPQVEIDGVRLLTSLAFDGYGAAIVPATSVPRWLKGDFTRIPVPELPRRVVAWVQRRRPTPGSPTKALQAVLKEVVADQGGTQPGVHVGADAFPLGRSV